jgi:hypothetical protein
MLVAAAVTGVALLVGAPSCGEGEPSSPAPREQPTGGDDIPYTAETTTTDDTDDDTGDGDVTFPGPTMTPPPSESDTESAEPESEVETSE